MQDAQEATRLPLEEIAAFVAVAEAGSYTAAAEKLGVSHSSLSRKVQQLEQIIGARLFDRRAHGVELTIIGTGHFLSFRDALGLLDGTLRSTTAGGEEIVRLSLLQSFATTFLFPMWPKMRAAIEGMQVRYVIDRTPTDFRDGIDLAVRFGDGGWGEVRSIPLWESTLRPMAGSMIAKELGMKASNQAILAYPLIHQGSPHSWTQWFAARGLEYELRAMDHVFEEQPTILSATQHGLGIALGRTETRDVIDGVKFIYVSDFALRVPRRYHLVRPDGRQPRPAVAIYARALLEAVGKSEAEIAAFLA